MVEKFKNKKEYSVEAVTELDGAEIRRFISKTKAPGAKEAARNVHSSQSIEVKRYIVKETETGREFTINSKEFEDKSWRSQNPHKYKIGDYNIDHEKADQLINQLNEEYDEVPDISNLIGELDKAATNLRQKSWECNISDCKRNHAHDVDKHDIREEFGVSDQFARNYMNYNPVCHCGVNELARLYHNLEEIDKEIFEYGDRYNLVRWRKIFQSAEAAQIPSTLISKMDKEIGVIPNNV